MNETITTIQPGVVATGELSLADITAAAGAEFASWLCGVFGGEPLSGTPEAAAAEVM